MVIRPDVEVPLLKPDGTMADPVRFFAGGITWEFSVIPNLGPRGKLPTLDLKMEVIDLGAYSSCYQTGLAFSGSEFHQFDATFHTNKSVFIVREFSTAMKEPNGAFTFGTFYAPWRRCKPPEVYMRKARDGTVQLRATDEQMRDASAREEFSSKLVFAVELNLSLRDTSPARVFNVSRFKFTYSTEHLGLQLALNLEWFERIRPNMRELLDTIPTMSKEEFVDFQNVLGLYYHGYSTGKLVNGEIVRIVNLAEQFGFLKLDLLGGGFDSMGKLSLVADFDPSEVPDMITASSGKQSFVEMCKVSSETLFRCDTKFDAVPLKLSIYSSTFNNKPYLSLSAVLFPPLTLYHVTVKVSSDRFQGQVSRYINVSQNSMGIPTLCRYSEELDGDVQLNIEVEYYKMSKSLFHTMRIIELPEMPGLNDVVLKFGEKTLRVNKDYLLEHFAYFQSYERFEKGISEEIELKTFGYHDVFYILEVLYHKTAIFTVSVFKQLATTADALVCDDVVRTCQKSVNMNKIMAQESQH